MRERGYSGARSACHPSWTERLVHSKLSTPAGAFEVVCAADVVVFAAFARGRDGVRERDAYLARAWPGATCEAGALPGSVARAFGKYFEGKHAALDGLEIAVCGTAFERQVWGCLRTVAVGSTTTYGAVASAVGRPTAARAVGGATHRNPVALVVPCHRVVGSRGALVGYAGGLGKKAWLLGHERG